MISRKELIEQGSRNGWNIQQLEIDYLQHIVLSAIFKDLKVKLTFKGGTALQKAYGLNRFSEDLDFDSKDENTAKFIENAIDEVKSYYDVLHTYRESESSLTFKLKIKGPLFNGNDNSSETIRIEISRRETPSLEPEKFIIVPVYTDLRAYEIVVMKREEILAEKVRALIYGDRARDVYDLWFLIKKGTKVDVNLVNRKLRLYSNGKALSEFDLSKEIEKERKKWDSEISRLTKIIPSFDEAKETILNAFNPTAKS